MKQFIKYPNPNRNRSQVTKIRVQSVENYMAPVNKIQPILYITCVGLVLTSMIVGYYSLFLKASVQGVFNSILILLSGVILFFMTSHETFVSKRLKTGVSLPNRNEYSAEYSMD